MPSNVRLFARPHQEIRNLKWGDFSDDMKHISLSGRRNKSGRNRIVPLNPYILQYLDRKEDSLNIFTNEEKPFNKDYFKTLWSRYKAQSTVLEDLQTLYSFRHTGAIEIYKENKQSIYPTASDGSFNSCCYSRLFTWVGDTFIKT